MSETPLEELARRALFLAKSVKPECSGNGSYDREYKIGEISLGIGGWWGDGSKDLTGKTDWNKEYDTDYYVDYGDLELLEGVMNGPPVQRTSDNDLILKVLGKVREHMVLDDLADV